MPKNSGQGKGKEKGGQGNRKEKRKSDEGKEKGQVECEHRLKRVKVIEFKFDSGRFYPEFLDAFRNSVHNGLLYGVRVTFVEEKVLGDSHVIDVHLSNDTDAIVVRIVCFSVYVLGYKSELQKKWFRYKTKDDKVFFSEDTTVMNIVESYEGMGGLEDAKYGYYSFSGAISGLNRAKTDDERKPLLRALCIMLSEAARSDTIGKKAVQLVKTYKDDVVKKKYEKIIHNWHSSCKHFMEEAEDASKEVNSTTLGDTFPQVVDDVLWSEKVVVDENYKRSPLYDNYDSDVEEDSFEYVEEEKGWEKLGKEIDTDAKRHVEWLKWCKSHRIKLIGSSFREIKEADKKEIKKKPVSKGGGRSEVADPFSEIQIRSSRKKEKEKLEK